MKTILLPTDFSNNALMATQFAVEHIGEETTQYHFIYVYNPPRGGTSGLFYLLDELRKQGENDMESYLAQIKKQIPSLNNDNCRSYVQQGDFEDVCNAVAKEIDADCIVVGTKGSGGIKEVLVGSNTLRLMKSLSRPLFAIPNEYPNYPLKELIVSYDGKPMTNDVAEQIKLVAQQFKLPLNLLHVRIEQDEPPIDLAALNAHFEGVNFSFTESRGDNFEDGLQKGLENKHALLILIRHKQSFWESLFNISDSRDAVMHTHLPMFIVAE